MRYGTPEERDARSLFMTELSEGRTLEQAAAATTYPVEAFADAAKNDRELEIAVNTARSSKAGRVNAKITRKRDMLARKHEFVERMHQNLPDRIARMLEVLDPDDRDDHKTIIELGKLYANLAPKEVAQQNQQVPFDQELKNLSTEEIEIELQQVEAERLELKAEYEVAANARKAAVKQLEQSEVDNE